MNLTPDKLEKVLREFCEQQKPSSHCDVEIQKLALGRLVAILTWEGFDDMEITERQEKVWDFLDKGLSKEELLSISMVLLRGIKEGVVEDEILDTSEELPYL